MDDLDFLKSHWQKDNRFPQVKAEEIYRMKRRHSTSIVRWIFIISILEIVLGVVLSFVIPSENKVISTFEDYFMQITSGIFYIVILYFIYNFFRDFMNIRSTTDTKSLLSTILKTRKHVSHYIQFNIYYIYLLVAVMGGFEIYERILSKPNHTGDAIFHVTFFLVLLTLFALLFVFIIKLYYRLIYGVLMKKLDKNYQELLNLERDVDEVQH